MKIKDLKNATSSSGGKASGLALLNKIGVPVPEGFVINNTTEFEFTAENIAKIKEFLERLNPEKKLAVRSSACAEDGLKKSFAGIFETELNVDNNIISVIEAIKKVNASATTNIVKAYSDNERQVMNIIIQEMVEPKIAGVLFTNAIDINGDDVVLLECVEGLADKLVSGAANPARIIAKIHNNSISSSNLRIEGDLIDLGVLKNIIPFVNKIKKISSIPLDIEWCIDKKGNPFFVQARPITSIVFIDKNSETSGIVASRGFAEGETYVIDENKSDKEIQEAINNFKEGSILVAGITETLYMPAIKKAKGIITEEGSSLSHAAIVSRELGIPCIAGYKNAIKLFPTGTKITLDALNGKIIANGVADSLNNTNGFEFGELYCFDNQQKVDFDNFSVVFELTYGGLMVHMSSEDATSKNIEILEEYSRRIFHDSPKQYFDDKYLWYFEIERFKKLPYFNEMIDIMKKIVKERDLILLEQFYTGSLNMLSKLVEYKNKTLNNKEKIVIDELGQAINLILDAMLPMGYAIRQCYFDTIQILKKYNLNFNDLFINDKFDMEDEQLIKVQEFLKNVSINRNEVYGKIYSMGAILPEYFEIRDELIKKNCLLNDIDDFYNSLIDADLENIKKIMNPFFLKKSKNSVVYTKKISRT